MISRCPLCKKRLSRAKRAAAVRRLRALKKRRRNHSGTRAARASFRARMREAGLRARAREAAP